jgi:hypothetical protein
MSSCLTQEHTELIRDTIVNETVSSKKNSMSYDGCGDYGKIIHMIMESGKWG